MENMSRGIATCVGDIGCTSSNTAAWDTLISNEWRNTIQEVIDSMTAYRFSEGTFLTVYTPFAA